MCGGQIKFSSEDKIVAQLLKTVGSDEDGEQGGQDGGLLSWIHVAHMLLHIHHHFISHSISSSTTREAGEIRDGGGLQEEETLRQDDSGSVLTIK